MKVLALELSSPRGSIAWREGETDSFSTVFPNDRKHSGAFFEQLQSCLARFGKADRIVVGLGPGSYAGTRIAIATALGLQAAAQAELIGLPSLCAMQTEAGEYVVIGDARRQFFFFARVLRRRCVDGPSLFTREALLDRLATIKFPIYATEPLTDIPAAVVTYPSAFVLAQIGARHPDGTNHEPLQPIYLREPHITAPRLKVQSFSARK
ncbi:MAG: tRNA (adenosine(37)-N6)-threonylcarbamoyltransferase complex dimerization subunit type 1 TsaB [Chthoniobacterales bacterium]